MAQDIHIPSSLGSYKSAGYKSFISASYVKFIESGGARVVPVFINQTDEYYQMIHNSTNGLLLPGGASQLDSGTPNLIIY